MLMIQSDAAIFFALLCSFVPPSCVLIDYHSERGGMPLHDAVRVNNKRGATTDIKAQVPSIYTKG